MQYVYIKDFTIKAPERFQYNLNLFYPFTTYVLYKYWCTLPEDDLQERVETCRSSSVLIVRVLYFNIMHLLVFSWILCRVWFGVIRVVTVRRDTV